MRLYSYFRSSAAFRVRIALAIKGLDAGYAPVHLARGEHLDPGYAARSASRLVPALETDDGAMLGQSLAIIEYLEETFPEPPLLPADPVGRARARGSAQLIACEIHPLNNLRVLKYLGTELHVAEPARLAWYAHWVREGFEALERELARWPQERFCVGDRPGIAECCLVPQVFNARRFDVDLSGLPRVLRVFDECMALEAFRQAQPSNSPDAE
jgi:maleylacetoacetate isomerase/maleylpyruvate isomerase